LAVRLQVEFSCSHRLNEFTPRGPIDRKSRSGPILGVPDTDVCEGYRHLDTFSVARTPAALEPGWRFFFARGHPRFSLL
jgi:hypothetical protein